MLSCTPALPRNPAAFYWPEIELFPELQRRFAVCGELDPLGFYVILDWKAPRARKHHLARLSRKPDGFAGAVTEIASDLRAANCHQERLRSLMTSWGFRLPTASAILSVLYPGDFTVYDIRVCGMLGAFGELANKPWSAKLWSEYARYLAEVRGSAAPGTSLRDCDRALWGASKHAALIGELQQGGNGAGSAVPAPLPPQ